MVRRGLQMWPWQVTSLERGGSICVFCRYCHRGSEPGSVIANVSIGRRHCLSSSSGQHAG